MTSTASSSDIDPLATHRVLARQRTVGERVPSAAGLVLPDFTCGCGQALEWYHASHCPRCGVNLRC
jgi:hypothetical protein